MIRNSHRDPESYSFFVEVLLFIETGDKIAGGFIPKSNKQTIKSQRIKEQEKDEKYGY